MFLGCLLGVAVVCLAIWFDAIWWMRIARGDRIGGPIWLVLTVLYGAAAMALDRGALSGLEVAGLVGAGVAHGVWGLSLLRDWRASLGFRLVSHVALGGAGLLALWLLLTEVGTAPTPTGLDEALDRLSWLLRLGRGELAEARQATLLMTLATGLALMHTARWEPSWPRRWGRLGWLVSSPDLLATAVTWAGVVTTIWLAFEGLPESWFSPEGRDLVGLTGVGVGLYTAMLVAFVMAYGLTRHLKPEELELLSLEEVARPTRPRLALPEKLSISKIWSSLLPTTGAATLAFTGVALAWGLGVGSLELLLVVGALLMPLAAVRAWSPREPFGAVVMELSGREALKALGGVSWVDGRLLLDRWRVRDNEDLGDDPPDLQSGWTNDRLSFDPAQIERVGFRQGERVSNIFEAEGEKEEEEEEAPPPTSEGEDEPPSHAEDSARRAWSFEVVYRGRSYFIDECVGNDARDRLEAMADLWFLGAQLGCPIRQPHRLIADPRATSGQLAERVAGTYRAFASSRPDYQERYAEALETWCQREDEQGRAWWLIPEGKLIMGGIWWLATVWALAAGELAWSLMSLPQEPHLAAYAVLLRVMLLGGFGVAIARVALKRRAPDVYALRLGRDGLQLQDTVVSWHAIIDLNLLPAVDFPPAFVTEGRLVGLPLLLSTDAQLALAAEAGHALARHRAILDDPGV